jgi:hypothetical protein
MNYLFFTKEMVPDASHLLANRHQRNRTKPPQLPARFEDPTFCSKAAETLLASEDAEGVVAVQEGKMVAYLS